MNIEKLTDRARGFVQSAQSLALREGTSNSPPTEVELVPRRPALDVDIAAEPQRIDRRSRGGLKRDDRGDIDDRNDLAGDIGEAVARRVQELRQSAQLVSAEPPEERLDGGPPRGRAQIAAHGFAPF